MKKQNKYDIFIDNLSQEFSKINNFHLTQEEGNGKVIFNFVVGRISEINSFKSLFVNYYLPASSKAVIDDLNEIQKSKYRYLISLTKEDLKENYYETIRLAYIGMFHKYENYIDDLINKSELLISELNESDMSLVKYCELHFNYKIKDWKNSPTISRLNWISICNKHYDGFPHKQPIPKEYTGLPENERMKFTKDDFVRDIDFLIKYYTLILQIVFNLAFHKMTFEFNSFEADEFTDLEQNQKLIDGKLKVDEAMKRLIEMTKLL